MVLSLPAIGADSWYVEYDAGLKAIASKDWDTGEARLKTALALQPKQGRKVLAYGVRFIRYIPEYYLGVVYFNRAQYQEAMGVLTRMQKNGLVVKGDPEFSEMTTMIAQANDKLQPKIQKQEPSAKTPAPTVEPPQPAQQQEDVEAQRQEQEKAKLAEIENLIKKVDVAISAKDFKQARELVKQGQTMGIDESKIQDFQKKIDVDEKLVALSKAASQKDWLQAQRIATQLDTVDPKNPDLVRLQLVIDQGIQDLEDRGLLAFLSGDYQQALLHLERVIAVKKDFAESWFYMGCSHTSLGLLQGEKGES
jgi:tetratricopeptide (TPR) repeat protein